jgi:hypothetical protein
MRQGALAIALLNPTCAMRPVARTSYMRTVIMETLGVGAVWAGRKMLELLESENGMVQYNASRFLLATGGGVTMPERSGPLVSVSIDQRPGWITDLTESDGSGTVVRPPAPSPAVGPVIEGVAEAVKLDAAGDPPAAA